ncbi:MAG TPA: hypothetical protein VFV11_00215 [Solimonas sp.]|nr:hypothetical protein [Solimonas sp.]
MSQSHPVAATVPAPRGGLLYLALIVVLLGSAFAAGVVTTVTALERGFTPIENGPPRLPGH